MGLFEPFYVVKCVEVRGVSLSHMACYGWSPYVIAHRYTITKEDMRYELLA